MPSNRYVVETPEIMIVGPIVKGADDLDSEFVIEDENTGEQFKVKGWAVDVRPFEDS